MTYTYQTVSNKRAKVEDAVAENGNSLGDSQVGTNSGDDYSYDANDNLISDDNNVYQASQVNDMIPFPFIVIVCID